MNKEELLKLEAEILSSKGQWFVVNSQTGHEEKVLNDLKNKIKAEKMEDQVFDIKISKGTVLTKTGKQKEKNLFPGYLFINMIMSEESWFVVRNTPGVTGFIGSSGRGAKPFPLTVDEVIEMLIPKTEVIVEEIETVDVHNEAVAKKPLFTAPFVVGDFVRVKEGINAGEEGEVSSMDFEKGVAVVLIEMFGRYTNLEISFENVEPVKEY
ncbi:transcription antitermination factor [Mesoplasma florum L1]|uniref:Transcription termination/antitermination protein NusG n=1 Tax=Mesoplasma florum (strain ATCC 33453 / NBRC 100688 / NCTC 11704 / L1) TaxID=265311 RepID=Q6F226_MESFL|nr:transcription termination/antitermination protein NusG [Mesoplasma florum]AAT75447.1 transcription antitermination factor [Mesoplasma florum L1]ATI73049.1 transcription termination/antitermination protein NusG [Mesoplasma florum]AVN60775.1 transcription termination/antitermination protein NusG [Mesoplasma florum]AVN61452.1 transcription termination/antitermination protein NusG [Mesoplasma florum]